LRKAQLPMEAGMWPEMLPMVGLDVTGLDVTGLDVAGSGVAGRVAGGGWRVYRSERV
jgi:hypothetical protein